MTTQQHFPIPWSEEQLKLIHQRLQNKIEYFVWNDAEQEDVSIDAFSRTGKFLSISPGYTKETNGYIYLTISKQDSADIIHSFTFPLSQLRLALTQLLMYCTK